MLKKLGADTDGSLFTELYLLLCAVFFGAIAAIMDIYFKKSGGARLEFLS